MCFERNVMMSESVFYWIKEETVLVFYLFVAKISYLGLIMFRFKL